jgi:hypothetical protein
MKGSSVFDCKLVNLSLISMERGSITSVNNKNDLPFDIKRVYYLYDVPNNADRGAHGHKNLEQLIVAVSGSFTINLFDGINSKSFILNQPSQGLLIVPGMWRELNGFSGGAICLVLASEEFDESDYIRDYADFLKFKQ